jgi:hypothetical protein
MFQPPINIYHSKGCMKLGERKYDGGMEEAA